MTDTTPPQPPPEQRTEQQVAYSLILSLQNQLIDLQLALGEAQQALQSQPQDEPAVKKR